MPHISDAKLTSHGKNARPHDHMYLERTFFTIQRTRPPLGLRLPKSVLFIRIDYNLMGRNIYIYIYIYICVYVCVCVCKNFGRATSLGERKS